MNSDDITELLQKQPQDPAFRQGVLLTYNSVTGANTVNVGGAVLTNLPFVLEGGIFNLQAGNVVIIMKLKSAWAILGRVVPVNDPSIINANDQSQTGNVTMSPFTSTSTNTVVGTINATVPAWANKANFFVTFSAVFISPATATQGGVGIQIQVSGNTVAATPFLLTTTVPANTIGAVTSIPLAVNFAAPGGTLFSVQAVAASGITLTANSGFMVLSVNFQRT